MDNFETDFDREGREEMEFVERSRSYFHFCHEAGDLRARLSYELAPIDVSQDLIPILFCVDFF